MDLKIQTLTLEAFLLVLVRVACFVAVAPVFGHKSINVKLRVLIASCISILLFTSGDYVIPEYSTVIEFSLLIIKEALVGLSIGFVSSFVMSALIVAGEFIDREVGFTMSTSFDPSQGSMVTITSELYDKMVYLIILITNLHFYILKAIASSYELIPLGDVNVNLPVVYNNVLGFIVEYFNIGFSIAMPVFLGATILNVVLGILTKSAPQMNMFAIGMQLKVIVGLLILSITIMFIPNITNFLIEKMSGMITDLMGGL